MKKFILTFAILTWVFTSCEEKHHGPSKNLADKYSGEVASKWIALQQRLIKKTPGFDPLVTARSYAYSGLTLYEAVVEGMPGYNSIASPLIGDNITRVPDGKLIDWAASANAAMAFILKNLFANTSDANKTTIDSLEQVLNTEYETKSTTEIVNASAEYGREIANRIFEWSKEDGGHEAYKGAINPSYVAPMGAGLWIPTPPAFSAPIRPYWGNNRSFVPNSAVSTAPVAPIPYSESTDSEFYKAADELYTISLSLTDEETKIVRHWADLPGNFNTPSHYTNIATQLVEENDFKLDQAAFTYAKHGIAINEALISVFKAKYIHNLIRPVSYIRKVHGHADWNTVIATPPHPEYPSAHATVGGASYTVLESIFGEDKAITDRTHEKQYGARTYENLEAYAIEAARSRVLAGIHYQFSADAGLAQGKKIGGLINGIQFR